MRLKYILASYLMILSLCLSCHAYAQEHNINEHSSAYAEQSLDELEELAKYNIKSHNYETALNIYKQYEMRMRNDGWSALQPDLLYNQAIVASQAGKPGLAIAYLRQYNIIQNSPDVTEMIDGLRMLVEHRVYQQAPATQFVRGQPDEYQLWERVHRFSRIELNIVYIILWFCMFALTAAGLIKLYKYINVRPFIFFSLFFLWLCCAVFLIFIDYNRKITDKMHFGVLTDVSSLRADLSPNPMPINDLAYVEGLTVRILKQTDNWVRIERVDGMNAWAAAQDVYVLHGKGDDF